MYCEQIRIFVNIRLNFSSEFVFKSTFPWDVNRYTNWERILTN